MTRVPERVLSEEEEAADASEAAPTHFDTTDFSKFLEVKPGLDGRLDCWHPVAARIPFLTDLAL